MLYELRIKLTTPMLGDQTTRDNLRKFDTPPVFNGDIRLSIPRWHWAVSEAAKQADLEHVDARRIMLDHRLRRPSMELYNRSWFEERRGKSVRCSEMFESIRAGAELTLGFLITDVADPSGDVDKLKTPSLGELTVLMQTVGSYIGISPWGSSFGYGRFDVMHIIRK